MDSDKSDCLEKEDKEESQHAPKSGKKKKKKKKKKSTTSFEESTLGNSESDPASQRCTENVLSCCQITPEEKSELNVSHSDENSSLLPSKSEETPTKEIKNAFERVTSTDSQDKSNPTRETLTKDKRKKRNKKSNPEAKEVRQVLLAEKYSESKVPEEGERVKSWEESCSAAKKPPEKSSSSPASDRKKKRKKKAGFLLSDVDLTEPQNDSDKEKKDLAKSSSEKDAKKLRDSVERESDFKTFNKDTSLLQTEIKEKNNLSKILIVVNGLGLDTLRKLFMEIHPTWSNKPDDAKNLERGKMKLKHHELARFNTGNIYDWDVSLMTTVLLYSKECAKEIRLKPGYENAIRTIKDQKNQLISHVRSERMTDDDFNAAWKKVQTSLITLKANAKHIEEIFEDDVLESAKYYRDMFLQELATNGAVQSEVRSVYTTVQELRTEMQDIPAKVAEEVQKGLLYSQSLANSNPSHRLQDASDPKWDEWIRFRDFVRDFDHHKNNYILLTDAMSPENLKYFSVLISVPWKIVLDFNPSSEEKGMYKDFVKREGKSSLIDMITPEEMQRQHASTINLARHIDPRKTQWMFVREREKDNLANGGARSFDEWKIVSVKQLYRFLSCCSEPEKMDKHKPLICVILPFRQETRPFIKVTAKKLVENFNEFRLHFVGVNHDNIGDLRTRFGIQLTDLSPELVCRGLKNLFQVSSGNEYRMPSFQTQLPATFTHNQFLFLQEYLDVLYNGCEDFPAQDVGEQFDKFLNEHRESFLSGNWISFVSLKYKHDAQRELGEEVRTHIQRLLDQEPTHSTIVEIHHLPGTGGSTIARRVLWDLHKNFPCAIAKLEDYKYDIDDDIHFINALAERIGEVQDICHMNPLILLDGKHARIEALSNKLVRVLNNKGRRAVLLSCLHSLVKTNDKSSNPETSEVHARFFVNVNLEDSSEDVHQFEDKYKDYIDNFKTTKLLRPSRVFHFPLLAMLKGLEGFGSKLNQIIDESFDEMGGLQKEIAVVVAFIKQYAAQETPACLLYQAFKKYVRKSDYEKGITYEDINQLITEQLLNLMVPARPRRHPRQRSSSVVLEDYSLQHPLVAKLVLKRYCETQKCDIVMLTHQFLEFPIFQDDRFFSLVNDLFIRNRSSLLVPKSRFSMLFEELKHINADIAAEIFCNLAEKTGDATVFTHAARFHARKIPPDFAVATELIAKAFRCKNATAKSRIIYDVKGGIIYAKLRYMSEKRQIKTLAMLEQLADEALRSFKSARDWPPTYANPIVGEVQVWISCIDWITINECEGDTDRAFDFITSKSPPFFRTCIGDSFYLLDVVDSIVQKEATLPEPEQTQDRANSLRLSLLSTFNKGKVPGRREKDRDIIRECIALCSEDKFPKCSQSELKRLQVHYILASVDQIGALKKTDIEFLLKLLEDLVFTAKSGSRVCSMAIHLMKVSLHITGPKQYSLEKGLQIAEMWIKESSYDPMPYFYKMMIYFIKILEGNQLQFKSDYNKALEKCKEKSQTHCRGAISTHFLKKTGEGMNRLTTRNALLSDVPGYPQNVKGFWTTESRNKLFECSGRIRVRPGRRRQQYYIELVQGNVELYLGKSADIGKVERDFSQGTMVYFVVSFTLQGPVANGITFAPRNTQNGNPIK
ncbi:uncharacterized protein LOC110243725 [Exaiptasia diaphana]|uniref:DZIP3-like HEPN domain-containing protein n=1 Tax=Exaiptasia diaphana TaxID=2652724 RepID=A0A913XJS8_EXADI|nr:uncharacterized protein LOC110243725 [Exaiptasia diaphana]KXJ11435.1 Sterile alpha motif domain-containing protein 9-like [Exaiptasia diaphana]